MISTNSPPESGEQQKNEMSNPEFIAAIGVFGTIIVAMNLGEIEAFYQKNYDVVHYSGIGLLTLMLLAIMYFVYKSTKKLAERHKMLTPLRDDDDSIFVGTTKDKIKLHVSDKARSGHVQIIGSTGRGKTESVVLPWLARDILAGKNAVLIDGKGDPSLAERIKEFARMHKTKSHTTHCHVKVFDLGDLENSVRVNPLYDGTPQQITDRIFTAFEFEDPYYKAVQYDNCRALVELIVENCDEVTFKRIYELLTDDDVLAKAVAECDDKELQARLVRYLSIPTHEREKSNKGFESQLAPFAVGEIATLVNGEVEGKGFCSIENTLITNAVQHVFVMLIPTLKYQELGQKLGKIFCQQIAWTIGERESLNYPKEFRSVYLDEFSAFVYDGFGSILNKARSANIGLHLAHQSLGDLEGVSSDFAKIINTNTNVKCLLGLNDPETADFFARHIGTETTEKLTERAKAKPWFGDPDRSGDLSIRDVESYKIHPNYLKNYVAGQGVLHLPTALGNVTEEIQFARL